MSLVAPKSQKIHYADDQSKWKKKSLCWKPSTIEAREGIIIHVKVLSRYISSYFIARCDLSPHLGHAYL